MRGVLIASLLILGSTSLAVPQDVDRYALEKSGDGYVRMDRVTGEMSFCTERAGQIVCRLAADERSALNEEIDGLSRRLEDVESRLAELERNKPAVRIAPTEEELTTALDFMQRFFRSFADIVKDLDKELGADGKAPDRT